MLGVEDVEYVVFDCGGYWSWLVAGDGYGLVDLLKREPMAVKLAVGDEARIEVEDRLNLGLKVG